MCLNCLLLQQWMGSRDRWILNLSFCAGTCVLMLQGDGIGSKAPSCLQVKSAKCVCESVGGEKRKASIDQQCIDIRAEFTCKVLLSSVASKTA